MPSIRLFGWGGVTAILLFACASEADVGRASGQGALGKGATGTAEARDGRKPSAEPGSPGDPGQPPPTGEPCTEPADPAVCEDLMARVDACFQGVEAQCAPVFDAWSVCREAAWEPCQAVSEALHRCLEAGEPNCDELMAEVQACAEEAELACQAEEEAVTTCLAPCQELQHELERTCYCGSEPPAPCEPLEMGTCEHLTLAMDRCVAESPDPTSCEPIIRAFEAVCAGNAPPAPRPGRPAAPARK